MRKALTSTGWIVIIGLSLLGSGCKSMKSSYGASPTSPAPSSAPPNTVLMSGMAFSPASITVTVGTTITWKNDDGIAHTSTSSTGAWDTGNIPAGGSATTTFRTAGTFPYVCTYHAAMGMTGTVVVQ